MAANPLVDLPLVTAGPPPNEARLTGILLHGRDRTPTEMVDLAVRLALPDVAWLAVPALDGTWYPKGFMADRAENQPALDQALDRLLGVVRDLESQGVPRRRVAWVGFSQGACLASEFVYRNPVRWAGLVLLTGGVLGPKGTLFPPTGDLAGTPAYLSSSEGDTWVPRERVEATAALFAAMGAQVVTRARPGAAHEIDAEEERAARSLLSSAAP